MTSYLPLALTPFLFLFLPDLSAQCDFGVDAGTDIVVCADDNTVRLNGSVSGEVIDFFWTPDGDLSVATSLIPLVFLDGTPQTFTLTARGYDPADNLIVNGDFEAGNAGFTTEYNTASGGVWGPLSNEGEYAIDDNSSDTHSNFGNCDDHTGGGNMMVVNGSPNAGTEVWCQFVNVQGGTDYVFNAFAMKVVNDNNDAELQFSIDGSLLGSPFPVGGSVCSWEPFNAPYAATATASVEICIVNQNTAVGGNDFAIDDIFFGEVCEQTDEVTISVIELEALAPSPVEIPCEGTVTIDASASTSGTGIFYNWSTTGGNITSGFGTPVIQVDQPGEYTLEVLFDDGVTQCTDEITVMVTDDEPAAVAAAATPGRVDCNTPEIELSGAGSSTGPNWTYSWTTPDGNIVSGATTLTPTINAGGTYEIVVFNPISGCTAIEVITVDEDLGQPFASINPTAGIPCGADGVLLDGSPSDNGPANTLEWITTDGTIVSGSESLMPFVGSAGTYQLVIGQDNNGCTDTATIVVTQEPNNLMATIVVPDTLDCAPGSVDISGNGSSTGAGIEYEWTTTDGNLTSPVDGLSAEAGAPGTYILTVRDDNTGCFTRDSVVVVRDTTPPAVAILPNEDITCARDTAILLATGSTGVNFQWSTPDGNILAWPDSSTAVVAAVGTYIVAATDALSGCSATDTVMVSANTTAPIANAGEPVSFTCGADQATLDGSNSSMGDDIVYAWSTTEGNIVSGAGTQVPVINAVGGYFLEVTDTLTGCSARDTVRILSNDQAPPVSINTVGDLDCENTFRDLDASASASGEGFTFAWSTADGNFQSGQETLTPRIDAAGTYTLTVIDTVNQCEGVRSVTVDLDTLAPAVSTGPDFRLDCSQPTDSLLTTGEPLADPFVFDWTTEDGSFSGANAVPNPLVDSAGLYVLTVRNPANGCVTTDSITVTENFIVPTASAGTDGVVNCLTTALTLGDGPAEAGLTYSWTTQDGDLPAGPNAAQVMTAAAGLYMLSVENSDNGCSARDSVRVTVDTLRPVVMIAAPEEINCDVGTFSLDAAGSSFGMPFLADWRTTEGAISAGGTSLTPVITAAGTYTLRIVNTSNFCIDSSAVTVVGDVAFPLAEAGDPLDINCRDETAELSPTGSDAGAGFVLSWSTTSGHFLGDGAGATPTVDSAGVYYLTVRDTTNGCETTDSVVVTADFVAPTADAGPNLNLTCADPELILGADPVPNYRYFWTTFSGSVIAGEQAAMATVNRPGNYTLRVTNPANGCVSADNVSVGIDTLSPTLSVVPPAELNCQVVSVNLTENNGEDLAFSWSTPDGLLTGVTDSAVAVAIAPGTYVLNAVSSDNGCRNQVMVTVGQDTASPVFTLAPAAPLNCVETVRTLSADNLGAGFSYQWTTADGNFLTGTNGSNTEVDSAGAYVLTVTNDNNFCSATDSILLAREAVDPALNLADPAEITCLNETAELTATTDLAPEDTNIAWSTNDGTISGGTGTLAVTASAAGTYQLVLTNAVTGCSTTATTTVNENTVPPVIDLAEDVDLGCFVADFTLAATASGQGDLSYNWATDDGTILSGGNGESPVITGVGNYALTVTDGRNGCTAMAEVFANQNLLETFEFTRRDPSCERLTGTIQFGTVEGGSAPFSYSIDGGGSYGPDPVFQGLDPDNYVLVVRDANGCELEDATAIVPAPEFELAINPNGQIDFGQTFQLNAQINVPLSEVDTIIWTPWDSSFSCSNCLNPTVTPTETRSYRVRVATVDGCVAEEFLTVIVNEENPIFFPTVFSPNGDGVNDTYTPFASNTVVARITSMSIFDRWGETVYFREDFPASDPQFGWDGTLDGRPMNPQVLVFSVEVELVGGELRRYKGDFTLVR